MNRFSIELNKSSGTWVLIDFETQSVYGGFESEEAADTYKKAL